MTLVTGASDSTVRIYDVMSGTKTFLNNSRAILVHWTKQLRIGLISNNSCNISPKSKKISNSTKQEISHVQKFFKATKVKLRSLNGGKTARGRDGFRAKIHLKCT